jgi:lipopolysaccharide export system permease protein
MSTATIRTYLLKELGKPFALATLLLLSIVWLTQSLRFLDLIMNKGLSILTFLSLTVLLVPWLLTFILPLAFFAGTCALLKRLNDDSELPPLFGSGLSSVKLVGPLLFAALATVVFGYLLSLIFMPAAMTTFKDLQHNIRNQEGHILLEEGTFNQIGQNLMVYLKRRTSPQTMEGILVHDSREATHPVTWMAKYGHIQVLDSGTPRLTLRQGIRQDVTPNQVSMLQFQEHTVDIARTVQLPQERVTSIEEYQLPELFSLAQNQGKNAQKARAELHKRLLWPLTPLPFVLLAAAVLLQPRARRHGVVPPLLFVISIAVGYQVLLLALHSLASQGTSWALWGQWSLPLLVSTLAFWHILRAGKN